MDSPDPGTGDPPTAMLRSHPGHQVRIDRILPLGFHAVAALYRACGYHEAPEATDLVLAAAGDGHLVGAVRICRQGEVLVLRGMQVLPAYRRRGIGSRLLSACLPHLAGCSTYVVPFAELSGFYGRAGFHQIDDEDAPAPIRERYEGYRAQAYDVILMERPGE